MKQEVQSRKELLGTSNSLKELMSKMKKVKKNSVKREGKNPLTEKAVLFNLNYTC